MTRRRVVPVGLSAVLTLLVLASGCSAGDVAPLGSEVGGAEAGADAVDPGVVPERFTIVPDDYHVPYAGTAEDGRQFFLSDELFDFGGSGYVGLFLWNADGTFSEIRVDPVSRPEDVPPGQAASADAGDLVEKRLAELGDYELEPITVEPFTREIEGVTFGWKVTKYEGEVTINIEPGDFIAYYAPWDGIEYDT